MTNILSDPMTLILIGLSLIIVVYTIYKIVDTHHQKFYQRKMLVETTIRESQKPIQSTPINRTTNLYKTFDLALDEYENQNIRIPIDIIEDLQTTQFSSKEEAISMIENHRYNWKQENNKKLLKGVRK